MAAQSHDELRRITADREPRRRGRPEVVSRDLLARRGGPVELRAVDTRPLEVFAEARREVTAWRHLHEERPPGRPRLGGELLEQREDGRSIEMQRGLLVLVSLMSS